MNGFPVWTLWGMGLSALGALIAIGLALIGQTPRMMNRIGLSVYRLDLRARALTGYGFALLLLAFGFFLAGVPLGPDAPEQVVVVATPTSTPFGGGQPVAANTPNGEEASDALTPTAPDTGAFPGLPPELLTPDAEEIEADSTNAPPSTIPADALSPTPTLTPANTATPTPTTTAMPTPTLTPTPTQTPTPTMTPTPIVGQTAVVNAPGTNVWVRRMPGGQNIFVVADREVVILLPGRASQGGLLWREISSLSGLEGWLQVDYLLIDE